MDHCEELGFNQLSFEPLVLLAMKVGSRLVESNWERDWENLC